jgi:pimeloyl-ACP methyl ester carboxylesterase
VPAANPPDSRPPRPARLLRRLALGLGLLAGGWLAVNVARGDSPRGTGAWLAAQQLSPRYQEVAGLRVRYVRAGSGPPVLLLHGLGSSMFTWRHLLPALAADHDVVALDFPGFGGSDQPADLRAEIYPTVVAGICERLGLGRVSVVGSGMGGTMAVIFAAFRPDRVERVVLLDPSGFRMQLADQPLPLRVATTRPAMAMAETLRLRRSVVQLGLGQLFFDPGLVTADGVEEYLAPLTRPGSMQSIHSVLHTYPLSNDDFGALVRRVRAEALLIWGRQDKWIPVSHLERYTAGLPRSRALVLDRCGHLPHEEQPQAVAAAVRGFLAEHP